MKKDLLLADTLDLLKLSGVTEFNMTNTLSEVRDFLFEKRNTVISVIPVKRTKNKDYKIQFRHNVYVIEDDNNVKNISSMEPLIYYDSFRECLDAGIQLWCRLC